MNYAAWGYGHFFCIAMCGLACGMFASHGWPGFAGLFAGLGIACAVCLNDCLREMGRRPRA